MKILFHISSMYGGGAERVMSNILEYSVRNGINAVLVTCYNKDGEYHVPSEVKRYTLKTTNTISQARELKKIIKAEAPDLSVSFLGGGNVRLFFATVFTKFKRVFCVRNSPTKEYSNPILRAFVKQAFKRASGVVFQTEDAKRYFSKKIQANSAVIYNPVSEKFFVDSKVDGENIVTFGRLTEQKNFALLIDAFSLIEKNVTDNLLIYGEGELQAELQNQINELNLTGRVQLMGRTDNVLEVLNGAKAFVMSSDFEGMPNALLEAVCTLTPSISTDCECGGPRIILDGGVGLLTTVGSRVELADAMERIVSDKSLREELSNKCKTRRTQFVKDAVMKEWINFFEKVVK